MREAVEVLGVQPDAREQLARARARARVARHAGAAAAASPTICPTRLRGLSDACGSWKTICISRRSGASSRRPAFVMSLAAEADRRRRSRRAAARGRGSASSCRSPTRRRCRASRPRAARSETSSTACTCPTVRSTEHAAADREVDLEVLGLEQRSRSPSVRSRRHRALERARPIWPSTSRRARFSVGRQPAAVEVIGGVGARARAAAPRRTASNACGQRGRK